MSSLLHLNIDQSVLLNFKDIHSFDFTPVPQISQKYGTLAGFTANSTNINSLLFTNYIFLSLDHLVSPTTIALAVQDNPQSSTKK